MAILINSTSRVITQGITGKTGQFHTRNCLEYGQGGKCFVAGVTPGKGGQEFEGIPIFDTVKEARDQTSANVSVIYVPPPFAAAAIDEALEAGIGTVICITEGVPVKDMILTRHGMQDSQAVLSWAQLSRSDHARRDQNRDHAGVYPHPWPDRGGVALRDTYL